MKAIYTPVMPCAQIFINSALLSSKNKSIYRYEAEGRKSRGEELESQSPSCEPWWCACAFPQLCGNESHDAMKREDRRGSQGMLKLALKSGCRIKLLTHLRYQGPQSIRIKDYDPSQGLQEVIVFELQCKIFLLLYSQLKVKMGRLSVNRSAALLLYSPSSRKPASSGSLPSSIPTPNHQDSVIYILVTLRFWGGGSPTASRQNPVLNRSFLIEDFKSLVFS